MSLYSALYAGVSGLSAQSAAMAGVADNITNINTVGYKGVNTQFRTLVTDGRSSSTYSAGGVSAVPQPLISKQGLLQASASSTDLGIEGAGFFVTRTGAGTDGGVAFSRAGSFTQDKEGYLRNASGNYLQGWRLDAQGEFTNTGNVDALEPVRLSEMAGTAAPTTKLEMRANLLSTAPVYAGTYVEGQMASGTPAPQFKRSVDLYDAQGGAHSVTLAFIKTDTNEWVGEIYAEPASDVAAPGGVLASGTIRFNPDGSLDLSNSAGALPTTLNVAWTNGAGSEPIVLSLGDDKGTNGLTQFNRDFVATYNVNGGPLGTIESIGVSDTGEVSAIFKGGIRRAVFQLPVATFPNPDGLTRLSGNGYSLSDQSGNYTINRPGALGAGVIQANKLEASTVDLAQEFTNMIIYQRAYSASSKIITTVDDMLQEISNLKR